MNEPPKLTPKNSLSAVIERLEATKAFTSRDVEYWRARDLQEILAYDDWRNFLNVVDKAKTACSLSGQQIENHFADTTKKVGIGSDTERLVPDLYLTRFACYLIAMNGASNKDEVATAQSYFAVKTREQELQEMEEKGLSRLELRNKAKDLNKQLGSAAKDSGVERFGQFHNAGYIRAFTTVAMWHGSKKRKTFPKATTFLIEWAMRSLVLTFFVLRRPNSN